VGLSMLFDKGTSLDAGYGEDSVVGYVIKFANYDISEFLKKKEKKKD